MRIETLDAARIIDVAEAALIEPALHGGNAGVDEVLGRIEQALIDAMPDRESWGTGQLAQQQTAAAEATFGRAAPRQGTRRPLRSTSNDGDR